MLKPITFTVTLDDGDVRQITADHRDYVAYEAQFNKSILAALDNGLLSAFDFILWSAMKRGGLTDKPLDEFLGEMPTYGPGKAEEPAPLAPEPLLGSSQD